jgi:hypothetical protein
MKQVPVYDLTVSAGGAKLTSPRADDPKFATIGLEPDENKEIIVRLRANKASIGDFTHVIEPVIHTPVLRREVRGDRAFEWIAQQPGGGDWSVDLFCV